MPRKKYTPEEIVVKLRQVDVLVSQGQHTADAIRQIGVSEVTYYRWRQEYGGLKTDQVKRLKELEQENTRLRRVITNVMDKCQSALDWDPRSASKRDPLVFRLERLAFAPSELAGVAETGRARVDV